MNYVTIFLYTIFSKYHLHHYGGCVTACYNTSLHKEHSTREHSIQQTKHCVLIGKLDYCTVFLLVGSILQTKNCILIG